MAQPMSITIQRDPLYTCFDTMELEIGGTVQPDRVTPWGPDHETAGSTPAGTNFTTRTINRFVAGDYSVRARGIDAAGNVSSWSSAVTVQHRPTPPAPESLTITGGVLGWTWSDP